MPDALLCSVPDHDRHVVEELLPGVATTARPFSQSLAREHAATRVLSVMIHDDVPPEALAAMPGLEAVLTRSDGFDHLPLDWIRARGLQAYHLEGYATESVAQLALFGLIALSRRVPEATVHTRAGGWDRSGLVGHHLGERTVGIIGAGRIGGRLAEILAGLGVDVIAYDIAPDRALEKLPGFRFAADLSELLEEAEAITLHVPLDDATRQMVGGDFLGRVRPGTLLVNTSRGPVVDIDAVARALEDGALDGFAADVLPDEPHVPDLGRIKDHPKVLLTPHLGAHNHATIRRRYEITRDILDAVLKGEPERVDPYRVA